MNWIILLSLVIMGMAVSFAIDADPKTYRMTKQMCFSVVAVIAMIMFAHGRSLL